MQSSPSLNDKEIAFIEDLITVCKKHNLSLGHEDYHGVFMVGPYDEGQVEWLRSADHKHKPNTGGWDN